MIVNFVSCNNVLSHIYYSYLLQDRKPRYIENLLKHAEIRNREKERRLERQVQKEREAEGDEFADKESFVTSAYRKKMEEMQKLEEEERKQDMVRNSIKISMNNH